MSSTRLIVAIGTIALTALAILAGVAGTGLLNGGSAPTRAKSTYTAPATITTPARTVTVTVTPPPPAPTNLSTSLGDGIFAVGTDVAPGTYKTAGPRSGGPGLCSYAFLPRRGATLSEAFDGNVLYGPGYMDLTNGQFVQSTGCDWTVTS